MTIALSSNDNYRTQTSKSIVKTRHLRTFVLLYPYLGVDDEINRSTASGPFEPDGRAKEVSTFTVFTDARPEFLGRALLDRQVGPAEPGTLSLGEPALSVRQPGHRER